jgi:hypothetical protein
MRHIQYVDGAHGSVDPWDPIDDDADDSAPTVKSDAVADLRAKAADPTVWLRSEQMTQTEVCLRLARHLLSSRIAAADVRVSLTGHELSRRRTIHFPVIRFLRERGITRVGQSSDWRGEYTLHGSAHTLHLEAAPETPDLVTMLECGRRLVVHASRGLLRESRSSGDHKVLRSMLGLAMTFDDCSANDVIAVAVPRSQRFRALASKFRELPLVRAAGLLVVTVDRAGCVEGLSVGREVPK